MTNTTDMAAMLGNLKFFAGEASCHPDPNYSLEFEKLCTPSNILSLLDQLEAERHKGDLWFGKVADLEAALKAERQLAQQHLNDAEILKNLWEKAEAELAAMKAKLANPVVLTDCTFEAVSHMAHWYSEGECVAWVSGAEHVKKQILEAGFTVKGE